MSLQMLNLKNVFLSNLNPFNKIGLKKESDNYCNKNGNYNPVSSYNELFEKHRYTCPRHRLLSENGTEEVQHEKLRDERGPYHTLLMLGLHFDVMKLYNEGDLDVLDIYFKDILAESVGKRKWNMMVKGLPIWKFVSKSDEAFALLVLENISVRLVQKMAHPDLSNKMAIKPRYSHGECPGWTQEGISRFVDLCQMVQKVHVSKREFYVQMDEKIIVRPKSRRMNKREKRKFDIYVKHGTENGKSVVALEEEKQRNGRKHAEALHIATEVGGNHPLKS